MDALGSLRGVVNPTGEVLEGQHYTPYGTLFGQTGTAQTPFGFTGEQTDPNDLLYLRARYYVPALGVFPSLDLVEEGNQYGYVGGDVVNRVDPSGMVGESPERWDGCQQQGTICPVCVKGMKQLQEKH
ncbi:MAG: RHS repeat-associated core domain-containing protein [Anaerolinea sp.]|nr:RHS repeat-associated core domain-containing protein [Anaerolinea sp.]